MILQQFHVLPSAFPLPANAELANDVRKTFRCLLFRKYFLEGVDKYLSVITDDSSLEWGYETKQVQGNMLWVVEKQKIYQFQFTCGKSISKQ
jgi:hypothetical protein